MIGVCNLIIFLNKNHGLTRVCNCSRIVAVSISAFQKTVFLRGRYLKYFLVEIEKVINAFYIFSLLSFETLNFFSIFVTKEAC